MTQNSVVEEYSKLAERYDARWSFYIDATARETAARMRVQPGDRVLDVGCGTGALLRRLAKVHPEAQLAGIDPVPKMLAVARRKLPSNVELREAWAERLPYDDGVFDSIVSCSTFHYIRQPVAALREMKRVLRPGGTLTITDWCGDYIACRICEGYLRLRNRAHSKAYRRAEFAGLLEDAGYSRVGIERYKINWLWGLITATARLPGGDRRGEARNEPAAVPGHTTPAR